MKITLVRHGQTESNYLEMCQGISNDLLNDTGRRECQRLREKLKDKHFDVCYMSPLIRAVESAMILIGDRVEMIPDKRLIDRDLGEFEGKNRNLYNSQKYWNYELNCGDNSVEPIQDIFKRCQSFVNYLFEKHKTDNVLIVAHSASLRVIKHILCKSSLKKDLFYTMPNCYCEEIEVNR